MSFVNINFAFGQLSITLKWRTNAGTGSTWMGPLAADLNNDGLMEIVINGQNGIAALDPIDGSVIWSKPYTAGHGPCEIIDLNKDSIPEILFVPDYVNGTAGGGVLALHGNDGSVYWYNRNAAGDDTYIAVADINADGYPEIYSVRPGLVTALTYDGRIFASTYTYYSCWGGLSIGDTDFDGVFEVYLGERSESYPSYPSGGRGLRAFWADNLTEIWAYPDILCSSQAPVLADVDGDGDLEIIILNQSPAGIAVINTDGSVNTYGGIYRKQRISGLITHSNPPVADLDGDGNLELIACGDSSKRYTPPKIWDLVDWKLDATLPFGCNQPPGVADVDGDEKLEIIAPNEKNVTIFKYNPATENYEIIYTILLATAHPFSIAQDIDGDGKLELVFNQHNSWVSVYDVEAPAPTPLPRSGLYFYSQYRTRVPVYVPPPGPPSEPIISDPDPTNGATNVPITLTDLSFTLTDRQNNLMNYTVTTDPDIGLGSQENVINGRYSITISGLEYARTYTWTITATDGTHTTERIFTFTTETVLPIVDPQFDDSTDSIDLRANSPSQDWYESRGAFSGGDPTLLTLDTSNIGGNTGKKAALKNYGISSNAYLTQEFSSPQTGTFTVSFDIYIDRIQDNGNYDRVGHIYIGDDSVTTNAPTGQASERFVLLAFYDPTPGDTGTDLELRARTLNTAAQSWSNTALWMQVATGLSYDTWYTIKIVVNVASQTYDVYVNGILAKDGISKMDVYPSSNPIRYITFSSDSDGRGDFYVDNVFSPAQDRYKLAINTVGNGSVERNPGESSYALGTNVTLTAVPADGWIFSKWTGDLTNNENPTSIIMDNHKSVTATFTEGPLPPSYDDVIFDSNFDMGNLINITYQSGNTDGYRYYTAATNYTTVSFADKHWWFYFSMENVSGKTITISIVNGTEADYSTSQTTGNRWPEIEPVYSYDNINWYRVPLSDVTFNRAARTFTINVTVPIGYDKIWLAPLPPYNIAKRDALFEVFASSPYLTVTSLGTSPGGQELKVATITDPAYPDAGKFKSYVIAQQHSGEVPGSWNAEGLIRFLLSDDPTAAAIRRSYIFRIVPIVNVDGVYYGVSRYTPLRGGVQYDLNRWWNTNPITNAPFEVRVIYQDVQAFQPDSFNDMHSTINTEQVSPKEALTYTWSTTNTDFTNFMNRIRDGGWPETVRAISTLSGGAFQNVHSRLGVTFSLSWENPHDELSSNPGVRLTVNDWMTWGEGWAKGNYLYFGDLHATLTVTSVGSGSVAKNPDAATYAYGTSVELTATAGDGYTFSHWEGDLTGDNNPATILMNGNKTVTAVFIQSEYTLTINYEGGGTVSRNYTGPYYYGSVVQLTAIADPHWTFSEWSGDLNGTGNPTIIVITGDMNITAHFAEQKYTITASVAGIGGTIQPSGTVIVTYGQDQTFIITPDTGYHVSDVMIDNSSIGPTTSYTFYSVDNNHTITAVFAQNEYALTIHVMGNGSIAKSPDKTLYTHGEIVELNATANSGWTFSGWSGDLTGTNNPAYITMTKNMNITAHFTLKQYVINASVSGIGGTIEPTGLVTVYHGEDVNFTITPDTGYHILNVLVDGEYKGAISTYTLYAVDMDHTITAFFAPNEYTLTVNVSPEGSGTVTLNNTGPYYYSDVVQLTAEPNIGWYFSQWKGDMLGSQNPAIIIIDDDKTVTATFTMNIWWNLDWQYRRKIIIDHTKVSDTLTNFPLLIEIVDSSLIGKTQPNGYDFVFTDADNVKLDHQIEFYNSTTGSLIVWVNVPYLSSTTDTILYMYYGNSNCENQQNPTAVWDTNYKLVLHLNENTGINYDSTINGNNGTPVGSLVQGPAGAIGNCVEFNGGYIELPRVCTSEVQFTFSAWIYARSGARYFISEWWGTRGAFLQVYADRRIEFYINDIMVSSSIILNQWYYVVGTFDGATARLYINDGLPVSISASNPVWPSQNMYIGDRFDHVRKFSGFIDEVRVSNIARNAAWILTEYNNQLNPTTFYSLGAEETFQETYILTLHVDGNGFVTITPEKTAYTQGETVTLTATPDEGYEFQGWSGDLTGTDNPATITMTKNMNITAHFTLKQYVINASVIGIGGAITPSGLVTVYQDEDKTFTITPDTGYHILDVSVDGVSQGPISTYTFYAVSMNHTITAIFAPDE